MFSDPFLLFAVVTTVLSIVLLTWYLVARPALSSATKIVLLLGIGVLPIMTAANGTVTGYHAMKKRSFCGDCHTMAPYMKDSEDPTSTGLAARHGRNVQFGEENCYTCHADYGMFGVVKTKLGGAGHVYYYLTGWRSKTIDQALKEIHIKKPFPNVTCIRCHSTQNPYWNQIGDHASTLAEIRTGQVSCASAGCHGAAHPFSYEIHERERLEKLKSDAGTPMTAPGGGIATAGSAMGGTP